MTSEVFAAKTPASCETIYKIIHIRDTDFGMIFPRRHRLQPIIPEKTTYRLFREQEYESCIGDICWYEYVNWDNNHTGDEENPLNRIERTIVNLSASGICTVTFIPCHQNIQEIENTLHHRCRD